MKTVFAPGVLTDHPHLKRKRKKKPNNAGTPAVTTLFQGLRQVQSEAALQSRTAGSGSLPRSSVLTLPDQASPNSPKASVPVFNPLISWRSYSSLESSAKKSNDEWTCSLLSRLQKHRPMPSSAVGFEEDHDSKPDSVFELIAWSSTENLESNAQEINDEWTSSLLSRLRQRRQKEQPSMDLRRSRISGYRKSQADLKAQQDELDGGDEEFLDAILEQVPGMDEAEEDEPETRQSSLSDAFRRSSKGSKDSFKSFGSKDKVVSRRTSFLGSKRGSQDLSSGSKSTSMINDEKMRQRRTQESEAACIRRVSIELNCPMDTMQDARDLFNRYAKYGADGLGHLDFVTFGQIVEQMLESTGQKLGEEELRKKIKASWHEADRDFNSQVDFQEFAIWYSSWGFQQEVLLGPAQILTRELARKFDLSISEVDAVRAKFDLFDEDGSGEIEFDEFEKLLYKLMKIPAKQELPASRLKHFWTECDLDGSGGISFEEFLQWYMKYFDMDGHSYGVSPMEQLYQSVRPNFGRVL